jgi:hypothetical protein
MPSWWNGTDMAIAFAIFLLTFFGTIAIAAVVIVQLPADYFQPALRQPFMAKWPKPLRWAGLLIKNLLGVLIVAIGIVLSLPGIPGQGLLMILLGLMLLDVPGKQAVVYRVIRIPRVIATINRLRARFGKAPLIVD